MQKTDNVLYSTCLGLINSYRTFTTRSFGAPESLPEWATISESGTTSREESRLSVPHFRSPFLASPHPDEHMHGKRAYRGGDRWPDYLLLNARGRGSASQPGGRPPFMICAAEGAVVAATVFCCLSWQCCCVYHRSRACGGGHAVYSSLSCALRRVNVCIPAQPVVCMGLLMCRGMRP